MNILSVSKEMENVKEGQFLPSLRYLLNRFRTYSLIQSFSIFWKALRYSIQMNFWFSLKSMLALLFFVVSVMLIGLYEGIDLSDLTRDPNAVHRQMAYVGFVSNLGIFIWASTITVCWISAYMMRPGEGTTVMRSFLKWSGLITMVIAFDDLFQLHETVLPVFTGLTEDYLYLFYIITCFVYTIKFYRILLNKNFVILIFAYLSFASSIIIDELEIYSELWIYLEDSFKFTGICMWCFYFLRSISQSFSMKLEKPVL